jgi:fumarate reductase (CoM/CoB) subunit A
MEEIFTEILIIGGGAAGLRAAIEAREFGRDVTVVSKGKAGRSGNTVLAQCNLAVSGLSQNKGDDALSYINDALRGGSQLNKRKLLEVMAEDSRGEILRLHDWGVRFLMKRGSFLLHEAPGHSCPRVVRTELLHYAPRVHGLTITIPLLNRAKSLGVRFIDSVSILEIVQKEGRGRGALGIMNKDGKPFHIASRTVILASGGAGRIFLHTNNALDIAGDSYALALKAGVPLVDMEFVQFYPTMAVKPVRIPIVSTLLGAGAVLRNTHGERFMERYSPEKKEMATRDVASRAIFNEIRSGRGKDGAVYLDCSAVSRTSFEEKFADIKELFKKFHIDMQKEFILVSPTTHFFMGGIDIDENCRTGVEGIYACGEAAGGIHGANRISGNALTDTLVTGARAGKAASFYVEGLQLNDAGKSDFTFKIDNRRIDKKARSELKKIMWENVSLIRSKESLVKAREELKTIEEKYRIDKSASYSAREDNETRNMLMVSEAIILASLLREESRGAHFREDFPEQREELRGNIFIRKEESVLKGAFKKN